MFVQLKKRKAADTACLNVCQLERILEFKPIKVEGIRTYDEAIRVFEEQADGSPARDEIAILIIEQATEVNQARFVYDRTDDGCELNIMAKNKINEIVTIKLAKTRDYQSAAEITIGIPDGFEIEELVNEKRLELSESFTQARGVMLRIKRDSRLYNLAWKKMSEFGMNEIAIANSYDDAKFYYDRLEFNSELRELAEAKLVRMGRVRLDSLTDLVKIVDFYKIVKSSPLRLLVIARIVESINNISSAIWVMKKFREDELYEAVYPKFLEYVKIELSDPSNLANYRDIYFISKINTRQRVINSILARPRSFDWLIRFYNDVESIDSHIAKQLVKEIILLGKVSISTVDNFTDILKIYNLTADFPELRHLAFIKMFEIAEAFSEYSQIYYLASPNSERRKMVYVKLDEVGRIELRKTKDKFEIARLLMDSVYGSEIRFLAMKRLLEVVKVF